MLSLMWMSVWWLLYGLVGAKKHQVQTVRTDRAAESRLRVVDEMLLYTVREFE